MQCRACKERLGAPALRLTTMNCFNLADNQYDPRRDSEFDEWGVPFHNDFNTAGERVNQQLRREQSYEDNRFCTRPTTGSTDQESSCAYGGIVIFLFVFIMCLDFVLSE